MHIQIARVAEISPGIFLPNVHGFISKFIIMQIKKLLLAPLVLICFFLISVSEAKAAEFSVSIDRYLDGATPASRLEAYTGTTLTSGNNFNFCATSGGGGCIQNIYSYGNPLPGTAWVAYTCGSGVYSGSGWTWCDGTIAYVINSGTGDYAQVTYDGTQWHSTGDIPDDTSTRFTAFTISTTTQTATITGYWTASSTSQSNTQELRFWQSSPTLGLENQQNLYATTTGNFSFTFPYLDTSFQISATSTSFTLGTDTSFFAEIYQLSGSYNPFSNTGTPPILLAATTTSVSATTSPTVISNNPRSLSGLPEPEDCSLGNLTGCIKNAGVWLFYPSSDSINSFKGLSDTLSGKFPFAYAYGMNALRMELFNAVQTSTTSISLTFKIIPGHGTSTLELLSASKLTAVPYSGTVKIILGWILWLLGVEYIYYRVLRSHDSSTPS